MSIYNEMRISFIRRIQRDLKKVSYPQPFCSKLYDTTNCMAYAFGFKQPDYGHDKYFPGGFSGEYVFLKEELLVQRIISDLKLVGITCTVISETEARKRTTCGQQVVALFYSSIENDFHFIRKDKEGGWSHKPGFVYAPCKVKFNYETIYESTYKLIAYMSACFI